MSLDGLIINNDLLIYIVKIYLQYIHCICTIYCIINDNGYSNLTNKEYACEFPPYTRKVSQMSNFNELFRCEPIPNLPKPTPSPVK